MERVLLAAAVAVGARRLVRAVVRRATHLRRELEQEDELLHCVRVGRRARCERSIHREERVAADAHRRRGVAAAVRVLHTAGAEHPP